MTKWGSKLCKMIARFSQDKGDKYYARLSNWYIWRDQAVIENKGMKKWKPLFYILKCWKYLVSVKVIFVFAQTRYIFPYFIRECL